MNDLPEGFTVFDTQAARNARFHYYRRWADLSQSREPISLDIPMSRTRILDLLIDAAIAEYPEAQTNA